MKILITSFLICSLSTVFGQSRAEFEEIKSLQAEFIKATKEYKASLNKLLSYYERDVEKAEERLELSKKHLADGLIPKAQVEENERALTSAKQKVAETNRAMAAADAQIAALPSDEELIKELKRARMAQAKKKSKLSKRCLNWDLVASQRQTANSLSFSFKIVCR